jgi:hypothetical protein
LPIHLSYNILTVLERLSEVADATDDILISVDAAMNRKHKTSHNVRVLLLPERNDRNKAEGKPRVAFYDPARVVSAIVTLAYYAFITLEL